MPEITYVEHNGTVHRVDVPAGTTVTQQNGFIDLFGLPMKVAAIRDADVEDFTRRRGSRQSSDGQPEGTDAPLRGSSRVRPSAPRFGILRFPEEPDPDGGADLPKASM